MSDDIKAKLESLKGLKKQMSGWKKDDLKSKYKKKDKQKQEQEDEKEDEDSEQADSESKSDILTKFMEKLTNASK